MVNTATQSRPCQFGRKKMKEKALPVFQEVKWQSSCRRHIMRALWYTKNIMRASNQDKLHTLSLSHTEHKVHGEARCLVK